MSADDPVGGVIAANLTHARGDRGVARACEGATTQGGRETAAEGSSDGDAEAAPLQDAPALAL